MVDTLVALADRGALPRHQFMDPPTVAWIASHRDEVPGPPTAPLPQVAQAVRRALRASPIPASWYLEAALIDSIHGSRHLLRTAALAVVLANSVGLGRRDTETLVVAAATHDCRRLDDKDDPGHGGRASIWLTKNAKDVFDLFDVDASTDRSQSAATAVRLHEVPYTAFSHRDVADCVASGPVTDLLKTADALDRYRMPRQRWWPRNEFLRVLPPPWLHRVAFELVVETEMARLDGQDGVTAVLTALQSRGLV